MEKEPRKVDYVNDKIQLLKSDGNGGWHRIGKTVKSLKSLDSMITDKLFDFQVTEEVMKDLTRYREEENNRREHYRNSQQYN